MLRCLSEEAVPDGVNVGGNDEEEHQKQTDHHVNVALVRLHGYGCWLKIGHSSVFNRITVKRVLLSIDYSENYLFSSRQRYKSLMWPTSRSGYVPAIYDQLSPVRTPTVHARRYSEFVLKRSHRVGLTNDFFWPIRIFMGLCRVIDNSLYCLIL